MDQKKKRTLRTVLLITVLCGVVLIITVVIINLYMVNFGTRRFTGVADAKKAQCAIVLGAKVWGMEPSPILQDRLDGAYKLYNAGAVDKILVSGDHGRDDYDEVNAMRLYLEGKSVPGEDIFMDHAGFDTYSTMYRARHIFEVESAIVVTQRYHLYRGVYIAARLGMEVQGLPCDVYVPSKLPYYVAREWLARTKDFFAVELFHPKPKYMGDIHPITGDGRATRDR